MASTTTTTTTRRRAPGWPSSLLLLLLLLVVGLAVPLVPGLRLLLRHPSQYNCSQPGLRCEVRNSNCMDQSWFQYLKWTPSAPSSLSVHINTYRDEEGKLFPVLEIEWKVATDASIQCLRGAELTVLQLSTNRHLCVQFDFLDSFSSQLHPKGGGRWNFSFNQFEVQPDQTYSVTVHHLPKLSTSGDNNAKSVSFHVPNCTDPILKTTAPCLEIGSFWEPQMDGIRLTDDSLLVSFNSAVEAIRYFIHVVSFQEDGKECKKATKQISEDGMQQRLNVTVELERNLKSCCKYQVEIRPFFAACDTDCMRHSISIPCPLPTTNNPENDHLSVVLPLALTLICILLVGSAVTLTLCMARKQKVPDSRASNTDGPDNDFRLLKPRAPLKPRKVWIVYSADHKLYVDVVMKFAQFLITECGTEVVLDRLNERQIFEMGPVCWLTRQKHEIEALSSKIIILCSRGTRAKWQAMLRCGERAVSLKQDNLLPLGDMFTPALNLILPDFKQPACFGMYLVCYFEGISSERDIPDPFNVTSKYQLMDKFEEVYFLIQDLEKFEPGRVHQIPQISSEKYTESHSGRQLKEALQTFQKWQAEHPDWFKIENACSEAEDDLQSLNEEFSEALIPVREGILKNHLIPQEPDPNKCCLINLLGSEGELGACKLLPQHVSQEHLALQTLVIPSDKTSEVQQVMPVDLAKEQEILSHQLLANEDWLERMPMIANSIPKRNSVILQEDVSSGPQPLPANVRQQLEGLMYSLYQQSIIPSDPSFCPEGVNEQQGLVFDESCKVQRQSVQSDQGYISRCSPLPSDSPVEEEEEEEEEEEAQEGHEPAGSLSPAVLDSLKSLQQQLLFQDIQVNFS